MDHVETLFQDHMRLVNTVVGKVCRQFPSIQKDEIESEAYWISFDCCKKWDANKKGKFSTYLVTSLRNMFKIYNWNKGFPADLFESNGSTHVGRYSVNGACSPERLTLLKDALSHMEPLAVEIINLVFSPPPALLKVMESKGKAFPTKEVLRAYLRTLGVGDPLAITEAFSQIKQTLEEV
jgi:hypothetical protein